MANEVITESVAIYDFSHGIHTAFNAAGADEAGNIVIQQLHALRTSCDHVVVALDSKPYRRSILYDGYKAGRKTDPELSSIWEITLKRVSEAGVSMARAPGEEADDVLATLASVYSTEYECRDVRIVTNDKDVAQCVDDRVRWFVPQLGKRDEFEIRDEAWVRSRWGGIDWANEKKWKVGPEPHQIPLVLAIMGDASDKIPGVKGIGVKGAVFLVSKYKTIEGMAEAFAAEAVSAKAEGRELPAFWRDFGAGMVDIPKWLSLTRLNKAVELDKPPLEYLKRVQQVADAEEPDWDAIEAKVEAETRSAIQEPPKMWGNTNAPGAVWVGDKPSKEQVKEAAPKAVQPGATSVGSRQAAPMKKTLETSAGPIGPSSPKGLALLRAPFPENQIGQLPKGSKEQGRCPPAEKRNCQVCGGWHHPKMIHLSYVGHAALTDRLLDADPEWSWEPMALTSEGLPRFDASGGLWIRLTVCGVTRLGYGHAQSKESQDAGAREKEVIGDALRNAGMRFGAALDLWHKGELHSYRYNDDE